METAYRAAVCGLTTTVTPFETRNRHVLTSAPLEPGSSTVRVEPERSRPHSSCPPPRGFHCTPLHVHPCRSGPKRKPPYHAAVFLYLYFDQMADVVLLAFVASELSGLDNGGHRSSSVIGLCATECVFVRSCGDSLLFLHLCGLILSLCLLSGLSYSRDCPPKQCLLSIACEFPE